MKRSLRPALICASLLPLFVYAFQLPLFPCVSSLLSFSPNRRPFCVALLDDLGLGRISCCQNVVLLPLPGLLSSIYDPFVAFLPLEFEDLELFPGILLELK